MKKLLFVGLIVLIYGACTTSGNISGKHIPQPSLVRDSTEYELLIIDPEFDLWYAMHFSPANDRSNEYYSLQNKIGVINWNHYYTTGRYSGVVDSYIDYQPGIEYGLELNRKLYWYFKYTQEKFRIPLMK